ncbi:metal ABC transporter solute-binding protein, Zn/Mn family [Thiolapillus brandeum]|nr:zinc ABC transporter substrate-binding protein [Thiolapillus brandeum]
MRFLTLFLMLITSAAALGKPLVFVSVLPQKAIVQALAGDALQVEAMVGKGFNPATYQPSPRQIARLSRASLYIRAGVPFEQSWLPRFRSTNPSMIVLDMRHGLDLLEDHEHGQESDPHIWTDPLLVKAHARILAGELARHFPALEGTLEHNYRKLASRLDALNTELETRLAPLRGHAFLVYHPAWSYFAHRYGLHQMAVEAHGKEPNSRSLTELIHQARKAGIHTIITQPQHSVATAKVLARELNAKLVPIDPLSEDIFTSLRHLTQVLTGETP